MKLPVSEMPVMKVTCSSCPFKKIEGTLRYQNQELADEVTLRTLFKGQQICHHPRLSGKKETHRCRGSYDHNKEIYDRMNLSFLVSE